MDTQRIRAMIVDDSAVARRFVSQALSSEPDVEVVGAVESGHSALERLAVIEADIVILDLEMPGMSGYETIRELKRRNPQLPVLVFSSQTQRGAGATVDALLAGADDYALKPTLTQGSVTSWAATQLELTLKMRALTSRARRMASLAPAANSSLPPERPSVTPRAELSAVVIGTSVGGPEALSVVIPRLKTDLNVPLFVVQHMPEGFTRALAQRLNEKSQLHVVEASHGQSVRPGNVYLAPGDFHMRVSRQHEQVSVLLDRMPLENGCRPSVDPLFRSAAQVYGGGLLALVLTGMGTDGLAGARAVDAAGGHVWVQDRASAMVWGMAGAVASAGLAVRTVSLSTLASSLEVTAQHGLPPLRREGSVP